MNKLKDKNYAGKLPVTEQKDKTINDSPVLVCCLSDGPGEHCRRDCSARRFRRGHVGIKQ